MKKYLLATVFTCALAGSALAQSASSGYRAPAFDPSLGPLNVIVYPIDLILSPFGATRSYEGPYDDANARKQPSREPYGLISPLQTGSGDQTGGYAREQISENGSTPAMLNRQRVVQIETISEEPVTRKRNLSRQERMKERMNMSSSMTPPARPDVEQTATIVPRNAY